MDDRVMDRDSKMKSRLPKGTLLFLLAALLSMACLCSTENLPSFITNLTNKNSSATSAPSTANVLMQDDFSNPDSGWEVAQYDAGDVGYKDGAYFVTSTEANQAMWGIAGKNLADVAIEVTATQISGPADNNNDFGVMCRVTETSAYSFNISGDGFYSIQHMSETSFSNLVEWTKSDKINTGNASNTIKVICKGSSLMLYVNGSKLAEATDTTLTSGDIALAATTYSTEMTEIHFDNLIVTQP